MADESPVLPMRRIGSGTTHIIAIRRDDLVMLKGIGPPFLGVDAQVVSVCGAKLNGTKVWMQNGTVCSRCQRIADHQGLHVLFCYQAEDV